jgi:hypothetical protein
MAAGCVSGGVISILVGWGVSGLLDRKYTWKDALKDFGTGCVIGAFTEGIGSALRAMYRAMSAADDLVC